MHSSKSALNISKVDFTFQKIKTFAGLKKNIKSAIGLQPSTDKNGMRNGKINK